MVQITNATRNVQRVQKYTLVQPHALVGIHIRCHYVSFAGGKYTLLMYAPLTMLFLTLYSNCLGLLCISCAASLFSGSSGFGSCRHKASLAACVTCQTMSKHTMQASSSLLLHHKKIPSMPLPNAYDTRLCSCTCTHVMWHSISRSTQKAHQKEKLQAIND